MHRDLRPTPLGKHRAWCSNASPDVRAGKLWPAVFEASSVSLHVAIALPIVCKVSRILSFGITIPAAGQGRAPPPPCLQHIAITLHKRCNFFPRPSLIKLPPCLTWKEPDLIALFFALWCKREDLPFCPAYRHIVDTQYPLWVVGLFETRLDLKKALKHCHRKIGLHCPNFTLQPIPSCKKKKIGAVHE